MTLQMKRLIAGLTLIFLPLLCGLSSAASTRGVLTEVKLFETGGEHLLEVGFSMPVRYLRHAPLEKGSEIVIDVEPITRLASEQMESRERETVGLSGHQGSPVLSVTYEGDVHDGPWLSVLLAQPHRFSVEVGRDYRSLLVRIGEALPDEEQ